MQLGADTELNRRNMRASFLAHNAVRRWDSLNLKSPSVQAVLLSLVATADPLIENFRPGVMARLGLGYQALRGAAGSVYCVIVGFGRDGPLAGHPVYDQILRGRRACDGCG